MKTLYSITGTRHRGRDAEHRLAAAAPGQRAVLVRDPGNVYDRNAIQVWIGDDAGRFHFVGFVPQRENRDLAAYIDRIGAPPNGTGWDRHVYGVIARSDHPQVEIEEEESAPQ